MTAIAPGKGLVVFSTGAEKTSLSMSSMLRLVEGASRKLYDKVVMNLDYSLFKSHFADEHGNVRTLQLPPGEYFLVPQIVNPYAVTTAAPVYRFEVEAGAATYIGNFWLADHALDWNDAKMQRDIAFFHAKNPALKSIPLKPQKAVLAMTLDQFRTEGTIWGLP